MAGVEDLVNSICYRHHVFSGVLVVFFGWKVYYCLCFNSFIFGSQELIPYILVIGPLS